MPNTLTDVKDIKVAQSALLPFTAALTPMHAFSTNFSPEPADKLDTVRVPFVGAPSQSSDFAGNYTQNADSTVTVIPVQLNRTSSRPCISPRARPARLRSTCSTPLSPLR